MKSYLTLLLLLGYASAFAQLPPVNRLPAVESPNQSTVNVKTEHWKTYQCENFEISYPPHWVTQEGEAPIRLIFFSPESDATPTFHENINIIEQDLQGEAMDLETVTNASAAQVESSLNADNVKIEYLGDMSRLHFVGSSHDRAMEWVQYYMLRNGYLYVITFTAIPENIELYAAEAERIMASLKF